jgi:UDP-N-acetylglucosamine 2-epimerase (non-hydrolysing)
VKIIHVVGARPNFMKVAPVVTALKSCNLSQMLIHTGQHYSQGMSDVFFEQLEIPLPDINLEVGSGTHAEQTAEVMVRLERVITQESADLAMVYGDVNSTLAASLVCAKLLIPAAHVEAGLRSFDRTMPEEVNRVLTDQVSSLLFTHSPEADINLAREGIDAGKIHRVGNVMIDTMRRLLPRARKPHGIDLPARFALVTLHRPSNVDGRKQLKSLLDALSRIGGTLPVIFPVHPRTGQRIREFHMDSTRHIQFTEPLSYLEFLHLQKNAAVVMTDSGGVQEETTFLGVPCLTMRENTERPITVDMGTSTLVGTDASALEILVGEVMEGRYKNGAIPPLWDGHAAERIANIIAKGNGVPPAVGKIAWAA